MSNFFSNLFRRPSEPPHIEAKAEVIEEVKAIEPAPAPTPVYARSARLHNETPGFYETVEALGFNPFRLSERSYLDFNPLPSGEVPVQRAPQEWPTVPWTIGPIDSVEDVL